jgi:LPXTG-motif cell wall-anchored protein
MGRRAARLASLVAAAGLGLAIAAGAAGADERPVVEVTAQFDKPAYDSGEAMKIAITVRNTGTVPARGLRMNQFLTAPDRIVVTPGQWAELGYSGPGLTLEPGQEYKLTVSGTPASGETTAATLSGFVSDQTGLGVGEFKFTATVNATYGHASGVVYGDKDFNGEFGSGEGLGGVTVEWAAVVDFQHKYTATTDAAGRFTLPKLPLGDYYVSGTAPRGWWVGSKPVTVDRSDKTDHMLLRATQPLKGLLKPALKFAKDGYSRGETAHVTVTLANSGTHALVGIVANCNRGGFGDQLTGRGPGWGDLRTGVTVAAGETKILDVTEAVPRSALAVGQVTVACDFNFAGVDDLSSPSASDQAEVAGGIGAIVGEVRYTAPGKPEVGVPGVRVVLTDDRPCMVVTEDVTDADGRFTFTDLPAGTNYVLYLFPPADWTIKHGNPFGADVRADNDTRLVVDAVPGPDPMTPELQALPPECGPAGAEPADATTPQAMVLANTGASVLGLTALGMLSLLAGAFLVVRRTRHTR